MNNSLTFSEVRAMYFNDDALILSPYRLFRYQDKSNRYYFYQLPPEHPDETGPIGMATGVTTVTHKTMPTSEFLIKWIADNGYDQAHAIRDEKSFFGSFEHTCLAELMINRQFNLDILSEACDNYAKSKGVTMTFNWAEWMKSDILAMAQFMRDYNVKPLAIELSLVSPEYKIAGTLDTFCEMDYPVTGFFGEVYKSGDKKGQPKETKQILRTLAIIDNKSGRNVNGDLKNPAQLALLKFLLNEMMQTVYGVDINAQQIRLYNWHPKDWQTTPGYHLIDQTGKVSDADVMGLIGLYPMYDPEPEKRTTMTLSGICDLDEGVSRNIETVTIYDKVCESINMGDVPMLKYDCTSDFISDVEPIEE